MPRILDTAIGFVLPSFAIASIVINASLYLFAKLKPQIFARCAQKPETKATSNSFQTFRIPLKFMNVHRRRAGRKLSIRTMSYASSLSNSVVFLPISFVGHGRRWIPSPRAPSESFPMFAFQSLAQIWTSSRPVVANVSTRHFSAFSRNKTCNQSGFVLSRAYSEATVHLTPQMLRPTAPSSGRLLHSRSSVRQQNRLHLPHNHDELFKGDSC